MEKENFSIEANYAINVNGCQIDLHNNFDFVGLEYDSKSNNAYLSWVKTKGSWVASEKFNEVKISFKNVALLKVLRSEAKHEDEQAPKTLSLLGYLHPDDVGIMDGSLDEIEANSSYHMIFLFVDGLAIKVFATRVICNAGYLRALRAITASSGATGVLCLDWGSKYGLREVRGGHCDGIHTKVMIRV